MTLEGGSASRSALPRVGALYGIDLATDLALRSDLALRAPRGGRAVDVVPGPVPRDGREVWRSTKAPAVVCRALDEGATLTWSDASFLVTEALVVVDAVDPAWAFERYLNPVMSLVIAARGGATLHAFVVDMPGGAVAIMGRSGHGKSSLGEALLSRGGLLVSDDLLVLDVDGSIQPGPRFIRSVTDDREAHDPGGKTRTTVEAVDGPVELALVVVISRECDGFEPVVRPMDGVDALLEQMYTPIAIAPDVRKVNLSHAVRLAGSTSIHLCERHHLPPADLAVRVETLLRSADSLD